MVEVDVIVLDDEKPPEMDTLSVPDKLDSDLSDDGDEGG